MKERKFKLLDNSIWKNWEVGKIYSQYDYDGSCVKYRVLYAATESPYKNHWEEIPFNPKERIMGKKKLNTFEKHFTDHINEPKQNKKWFKDRIGKGIYSFQMNCGMYITNKDAAEMFYDLQEKGRRYKDLI